MNRFKKQDLQIAILDVNYRKYAIIYRELVLDRFYTEERAKHALKERSALYQYYARTKNAIQSDLKIKKIITNN